jgi:hypothetical protein
LTKALGTPLALLKLSPGSRLAVGVLHGEKVPGEPNDVENGSIFIEDIHSLQLSQQLQVMRLMERMIV